jgi:hypothetical protein
MYRRDRDGGAPELIEKLDAPRTLTDLNQLFLVYTQIDPKTRGDLYYAPVENGKPGTSAVKLVGTEASENSGQLSPNGKWLAYRADEAGRLQVVVRSFPDGQRVWPVSGADPEHIVNAFEPRWSADSKQLYFLTGVGPVTLWVEEVGADRHGGSPLGSPHRLFDLRIPINLAAASRWNYSPRRDGKRFLVNALVEPGQPTVNIITNWQKSVSR